MLESGAKGKIEIIDGKIVGGQSGIYGWGANHIIIGEPGKEVNITRPEIEGRVGIFNVENKIIEIYDGIFKGTLYAIYGDVSKVEPGYAIYTEKSGEGEVNGKGEVAYLKKNIVDVKLLEDNITYTGSEIEPAVEVTWSGEVLVEDEDYTVKYENNTNAGIGTGKVIITGKNDYIGTVELTFTIDKAHPEVNVEIKETEEYSGKLSSSFSTKSNGKASYQWWYMDGDEKIYIEEASGETYNATPDMSRKNVGVTVTVTETDNYYEASGDSNTIYIIINNYTDGKEFYATLMEAFLLAENNAVIKPLRNITDDYMATVESDKSFTLDLDGKVITPEDPNSNVFISVLGILTIQDASETSGKINAINNQFAIQCTDEGTLTINSGSIIGKYDGINMSFSSTGDLIINGGSVEGIEGSGIDSYGTGNFTIITGNIVGNETGISLNTDSNNKIDIRDSKITAEKKGIQITTKGACDLTVNNTNVTGNSFKGIEYKGKGTVTIESGNIFGGCIGIDVLEDSEGSLVIKDGLISNGSLTAEPNRAISLSGASSLLIEGGTIQSGGDAIGISDTNTGDVIINNGKINSILDSKLPVEESDIIDNAGSGNITINGGTLTGLANFGINQKGKGNSILKITGGTITSEYRAVYNTNACELIITGGTLTTTGENDGIGYTDATYLSSVYSDSTGKVVIGTPVSEENKEVSIEIPCIVGEGYGLYASNGFEFYDGILKGKVDSYNAPVNKVEEGYGPTHEIQGEYKVSYLVIANYTDETYFYENLELAFEKSENGTTIKPLKSLDDESLAILESGKEHILDLNGFIITKVDECIVNNGTLTITGTGTLQTQDISINKIESLIKNSGILNVSGGEIINTGKEDVETNVIINVETGKINVSNGEIVGEGNGINNNETGTVELTNGSITGKINGIKNDGNVNIIDGTITSEGNGINNVNSGTVTITNVTINSNINGINNEENGSIKITNATISSNTTGINNIGTVEITNATIKGTTTGINNSENGKLEITNVEINGSNDGISNSDQGKVTIKDGTIIGETNGIINTGSSLIIIAGNIEGKTGYGINSNSGTLTIGERDKVVSITIPCIKGKTYGINAENGFNFFDGILKGETDAFNGNVNAKEVGYIVEYGSEDTLITAYLVKNMGLNYTEFSTSNAKWSGWKLSGDAKIDGEGILNLTGNEQYAEKWFIVMGTKWSMGINYMAANESANNGFTVVTNYYDRYFNEVAANNGHTSDTLNLTGKYNEYTYTNWSEDDNSNLNIEYVKVTIKLNGASSIKISELNFAGGMNDTYTGIRVTGLKKFGEIESIKYVWSKSDYDVMESEVTNVASEGEIIWPEYGSKGTYYLWTLTTNKEGNSILECSNAVLLDNIEIELNNDGVSLNKEVKINAHIFDKASIYSSDYEEPNSIGGSVSNHLTAHYGANSWLMQKSGNGNEWHGMNFEIKELSNLKAGTYILVSSNYRSSENAGLSYFELPSITSSNGSKKYKTTIVQKYLDIFDDDNEHHVFYLIKLEENINGKAILNSAMPNWGYSEQSGNMIVEGIQWFIFSNEKEFSNDIAVQKFASGSKELSYFREAGTEFTGTSFSVTENGLYTVYAKSVNGVEKIKTIRVYNVDEISPTVDIDLSGYIEEMITGDDVGVIVTGKDEEGGILDIEYSFDKSDESSWRSIIPTDNNNLLKNSDFYKLSEATYDWSSLLNGMYMADNWSGYNKNVTSPKIGYHAHIDKDKFASNMFALIYKNSEFDLKDRELSFNTSLKDVMAGEKYTVSFDMLSEDAGMKVNVGLKYYIDGESTMDYYSGTYTVQTTGDDTNHWIKRIYTFEVDDKMNEGRNASLYFFINSGDEGTSYIKNVKMEEGSTHTDWTPNIEEQLVNCKKGYIRFDKTMDETVYFKVTDGAGNYEIVSKRIIIDKEAPEINKIEINNGANTTKDVNVVVHITSTDKDLKSMCISNSDIEPTYSDWKDYKEFSKHKLVPGNGEKTIYVWLKDKSGNVSKKLYKTINLNSTYALKLISNQTYTGSLEFLNYYSVVLDGITDASWQTTDLFTGLVPYTIYHAKTKIENVANGIEEESEELVFRVIYDENGNLVVEVVENVQTP